MEKLQLEDFTKFKFLSGLKYSPSGSCAAFVVHRMDVEENKYLSNIWVLDTKTKKYFQLTSFNEERGFVWLDDDYILFAGSRNPKDKEKAESGEEFTKYYKINIHGGEAVEAFVIPKKVTEILPVDDDTFLLIALYNVNKKDLEGLSEEEKKKELERRKEEKDYEVFDEIPFWANGEGVINKDRGRLYVYKLSDNKLQPITDEYTDVYSLKLNKDKTKAVFIGKSYKGKMPLTSDVYIYNLKVGELKKVNKDSDFSYRYVDFLGDKIICAGTDMKKYGINENSKFYILEESGERRCITPELDMSLGNSVNSDVRYGSGFSFKAEGDYLYFISTERYNAYLNRINLEGKIEKVIDKDGSVDMFDVCGDNILFIGFRGLKLLELYEYKDGQEIQITDFNEWVQKEKKLSKPERVEVETRPGHFIDGWVIKPVDYEEGKKYPAILDIHGGPKTVYGEVYFHEMQYWASEGYFVFFCNPVGSDGRGNEFADIRGKYGTIDYEDIMKFTDYVLENYKDIDPERVGVTGGSYGGFMTNWIIGHTDRFKAAVSQRSISNWFTEFGTTDIGYYFVPDQVGGTPWDNFEKYWDNSPLKYADKVKTPTLFLHSDEDFRCWLAEALQMFTALKYFGVESRLVICHGENHDLSRSGKPKHRIRRLKEITDWFNKYLKG
ncbi:dipeptidyl aminopeptidase/acylaminoacyl peptidase [Caldanaerobacter subterraneus subsp. tengcongensis MB4]|uniref:Dipeptidyl aminopeptidases/acylaminoacyl-peptidases n=1 Tax=Caldanaerobacter subterraneus subsp. tengcongensis (strain DSM 15242 / JCM 11007 / NBRC 100824 / MB4) TaxID=273068 RepID=Q8R7Q6_CALS4|nr:S9 family peptidase [Caldanaerobacter subterraneus]AAM25483.1 Dipeptidyl aminopeptidases/acylaminoacyl-peptidases [Caldanaerobacter subterraneus subsp. tengcongensis MB4]MCS3914912.1 dipeptidyl aminopeptidase/acylaminoacyl peptidase [Caldanaerobacter subterraneus subsp. tengcongensis MB4]